jgi:hypothetical protein
MLRLSWGLSRRKEESSFSEEKEAKRLFPMVARAPGRRRNPVGRELREARPKVFLLLFLQKKKNPFFLTG